MSEQTALYDREIMIINSRVLRAIAATLRGLDMKEAADEIDFVAHTLVPRQEE